MNASPKNLATVAAAALVFLGGFYYFFLMDNGGETVISEGAPASDAEISFIELAGKLDSIAFDTGMLGDPRFTRLIDMRTSVVDEPKGRVDPFGPLGR